MAIFNNLPTLLVSGVAEKRSDDWRETALTRRLVEGVRAVAGGRWNVEISWGEIDGAPGAKSKLSAADALIVMGGPDISPCFYDGDAEYENATAHFRRADEAQLGLISAAIDQHLPMLGICRGMQLLNVAQGGTLIQDITALPGHSTPDLLEDFQFSRHTVNVAPGSHLADALAPEDPHAVASGLRTMIHSAHHQAVEVLGSGLSISAIADDGTVEAVEHGRAPAIGVQWHPEDPDANPEGLSRLLSRMSQLCGVPLSPSAAVSAQPVAA